jgi:phosphoenolpyruvate carboxykinase (ATP)
MLIIFRNLSVARLTEFIIKRGDGQLSNNGSVVINTGKYTGRSPKDRFIVSDDVTRDTINWGGSVFYIAIYTVYNFNMK